MKRQTKKLLLVGGSLLAAFLLWTLLLLTVDLQPIGPQNTTVGLATLNAAFHRLTGVHMGVYLLTDWLGLLPIAVALGFGLLGLVQWCRRKRLCLVDRSLLALGGFYLTVIALFLFFECAVVNFRPVLINGSLEPSYPSSTTLLVTCVMPSAALQLHARVKRTALRRLVCLAIALFAAFMVLARLLSGVHWLTDVIGGALLSAGLVTLYAAVCGPK